MNLITAAVTFIFGTGGTLLLTWFFGKRKEKAEVGKTEAESQKTTAEVSMDLNTQLMQRISDLEERVGKLEKDNNVLAKELIEKDRKIMEFEIELKRTHTP